MSSKLPLPTNYHLYQFRPNTNLPTMNTNDTINSSTRTPKMKVHLYFNANKQISIFHRLDSVYKPEEDAEHISLSSLTTLGYTILNYVSTSTCMRDDIKNEIALKIDISDYDLKLLYEEEYYSGCSRAHFHALQMCLSCFCF